MCEALFYAFIYTLLLTAINEIDAVIQLSVFPFYRLGS